MARREVDERARLVVERHLQLPFDEAQIEPGAAEHQLAQPVHEALTVECEHLVAALKKILAQRADRELDAAARDQLHQVGALVLVSMPGSTNPSSTAAISTLWAKSMLLKP